MPWLNVELTDESLKMQMIQNEKDSYANVIEQVRGNVVEDIADQLEEEFLVEEIRDIIQYLMPTQRKNLSFLDTLVQERRVIWPKDKSKFFTYPCLTKCCFKYDHKVGVIVYASIAAFVCGAAIIALPICSSLLESLLPFKVPAFAHIITYILLALNIIAHLILIVGAWKQSSAWMAPWLIVFGGQSLVLLGYSVRYSMVYFLDANYELLSIAIGGLIIWGFSFYFWFVVASLSIRFYNFLFFDEFYGIPKAPHEPSNSGATQPSNSIEMTTR